MTPAALSGADAARLAAAPSLDYAAIGFRCGLEIHQQLDTRKLFSPCPSEVVDPDQVASRTRGHIDRRLRVTGSELGELDPAAVAESRRGRSFRYLILRGLTSLVETDEEPPHPMSEDALAVALQFAALVAARPAAEVHVMRKTVIDGSNTSGFQRTALVATGGRVDVEGGDVGLWTMALEEDSARKLDEAHGGLVTYTLDRLGIPLLEVSTAPDVRDPAHAQRAAARIGALLRATGRVKRGLGTIRQDLNVSVAVGQRVEVKGCQDLRAIPRIIANECRRQLWLHHVREELRSRGFDPSHLGEPVDVSAVFEGTSAKAVADGLRRGQRVLGMRLWKLHGLLKGATKDGPRLGRELADHARVHAGVKGIFHSDELPAYGITEAEVAAVRKGLACSDADAFALCVEEEAVARKALAAVAGRARLAAEGTPREVRGVQPDDTTRFLRPMPGAARMYPETDVPPIPVGGDLLRRAEAAAREARERLPERRVPALAERHGVGREVAGQLVGEGTEDDFERFVAAGVSPGFAARVLLQESRDEAVARLVRLAPSLRRVLEVSRALDAGAFAKEAIPTVLPAALKEPDVPLATVLARAGVTAAGTEAVDEVCRRVVQGRLEFVRSRGEAAIGPLMGPVMAELRGKADGQVISARLQAAIREALR